MAWDTSKSTKETIPTSSDGGTRKMEAFVGKTIGQGKVWCRALACLPAYEERRGATQGKKKKDSSCLAEKIRPSERKERCGTYPWGGRRVAKILGKEKKKGRRSSSIREGKTAIRALGGVECSRLGDKGGAKGNPVEGRKTARIHKKSTLPVCLGRGKRKNAHSHRSPVKKRKRGGDKSGKKRYGSKPWTQEKRGSGNGRWEKWLRIRILHDLGRKRTRVAS